MQNLQESKILVIGGTGHIGRNCIEYFLQNGIRKEFITSLSRNPPIRPIQGVRYLFADLANLVEFKNTLNGDSYDIIIQASGAIYKANKKEEFDLAYRNHYIASQNLCEIIKAMKVNCFLYIGSAQEYGSLPSPQKEEDIPSPNCMYGTIKYQCTQYLLDMFKREKLPLVIIRPTNVYGNNCKIGIISYIMRQIRIGGDINVTSGEQSRDFIHTEDLCRAIFLLLDQFSFKKEKFVGEIFNISSGTSVKVREVIQYLATASNVLDRVHFGAIPYRPDELMNVYCSNEKIRKSIGYTPGIPLSVGLKRCLEEQRI